MKKNDYGLAWWCQNFLPNPKLFAESRLCEGRILHADRAIGYTPETVWLIQASMR
jgi:hypothetical protein